MNVWKGNGKLEMLLYYNIKNKINLKYNISSFENITFGARVMIQ